jgi:hypothetical protein
MMERLTHVDPQGAHGLEHVLGINSAQSNPDWVDLSHIRPVIDMGQMGHARLHDPANVLFGTQTIPIEAPGPATVSSFEEWILSHANHAAFAGGDLVYRQGYICRPICIWYQVHIEDPAGALTGNTYRVYLTLESGGWSVPFWTATHMINDDDAAATYGQYYKYPGDTHNEIESVGSDEVARRVHRWASGNQIRCPIVPSTWGMKIHLYTNCKPVPAPNSFQFPLGSIVNLKTLIHQVPIGAAVPNYW